MTLLTSNIKFQLAKLSRHAQIAVTAVAAVTKMPTTTIYLVCAMSCIALHRQQ